MKIIIYVDYSSLYFNKDFKLSNSLLENNQVLLVINDKQLFSAINNYDILLLGYSYKETNINNICIPIVDCKNKSLDKIIDTIKEKQPYI